MSPDDLSPTQKRVLVMLHQKHPFARQLSGDKMIAICSAARALVRKGLAHRLNGSSYALDSSAVGLALECRNEARAEKGLAPLSAPAPQTDRGEGA